MDNLITLLELTDLRIILGSRIQAQCDRLGISHQQLGDRVGLHRNAIQQIADGKRWPQYANLEAIAACLGVDIEYFFAEVEAKPLKPTPQEALAVLADLVKRFGDSVIQPSPATLADALGAALNENEFKDIATFLKDRTNGRIDLRLPPKVTKSPHKAQKPG